MKLQFDANQDYQLEAIQSIVDVFAGQTLESDELSVVKETTQKGQGSFVENMTVGNQLQISPEQITKNVQQIQKRNTLPESEAVLSGGGWGSAQWGTARWGEGGENIKSLKEGNNFTIEMETGTGKTYVYLRTIHELHKNYGFKKFIIVVPSVAIKEGVIKNLQITKDHFATIYGNPKMDYHVWDPRKRGQARAFATNNSLQILIITIDSFAKLADKEEVRGKPNVIYQNSDWGVPMKFIQQTNPIVILDEPQNMETDIRKKAIARLNPLCTLRYSATHKYPYNLLYKLDPVKAYDLGLVKKIEVDSVMSEDSFNSSYLHLIKIDHSGKNGIVAHLELDKDDTRGLQRQIVKVSGGEDLYALTHRDSYRDYIIDRIDFDNQYLEFGNGKVIRVGQRDESLHDEIVKYQIQRTIINHLDKEKKYKKLGIKVLSLFFIDKVANYREYGLNGNAQKGKFAKWFEELYAEMVNKPRYKGIIDYSADSVHNGYFSADKSGKWEDTKGESVQDDTAYSLIMREKEKLLDPSVPLRFIFSHSALREGWDNPNVFQICTINETSSEMKKRQEIGRGLRLPVNTKGERVRDESVNILTVIANESYDSFAKALQSEIESETGVEFEGRIKNQRDRQLVKLKKNYQLDTNFKAIWDRIKYKSSYHVTLSTHDLVLESSKALASSTITSPRITNTLTFIKKIDLEKGLEPSVRESSGKMISDSLITIPDVVGKIEAHTHLTRDTIYQILVSAEMIKNIIINPQQVIDETIRVINQEKQKMMVDGIKYEKVDGSEWDMQLFENQELETYLSNLVEVQNQDKTLYDYVAVDSPNIEGNFAKELDSRDDIKFYFKLPNWFKIETPLGGYNPDWAVIFEGDKRIYFVAETKGTNDINDIKLTPSERFKIICGKAHFDLSERLIYVGPIDSVEKMISKSYAQ